MQKVISGFSSASWLWRETPLRVDRTYAVKLNDHEGTMRFDWSSGALAEGLRCYRNEEFFLAHEHWESVWLTAEGPEKTFLQALIQIAAAFHHLQRGNTAGAASLLRAALRRLGRFPDRYGDIAVTSLRESIGGWLQALDRQESGPHPAFPPIR
jgi:predicted metal-dependent hydrolase